MAAAHVKAAKKLTRVKIRAISLAGKALLEEDIFDRVFSLSRLSSFDNRRASDVKLRNLFFALFGLLQLHLSLRDIIQLMVFANVKQNRTRNLLCVYR